MRTTATHYLDNTVIRQQNAVDGFVQNCMDRGFTESEGRSILALYRKCKAVKVDLQLGRITVKHGGFWDVYTLRNALRKANQLGL